MKNENGKNLYLGIFFLIAFMIWTVLVIFVDVKVIGPENSEVGLALLNSAIHNFTGVNMALYMLTDWLSIAPFCFIFAFGFMGLIQWIKRKSIFKVDSSIIVLGAFYIAVIAVYLLFEMFVVNYRPVLIEGILEASYPSSTTVLVISVMSTALMQINSRIEDMRLKRAVNILIASFTVFMVVARFVSGVHWFTDIIGGILLSTGLVMLYRYFADVES